MRKLVFLIMLCVLAFGAGRSDARGTKAAPDWSFNATIIEACSCPMFCQCYFATKPASHGHGSMAQHFCRFNMAYKVNRGSYGNVKLDGARLWIAGDLGGDFSMGQTEWAEATFDPAVTKEQREALAAILLGSIYPFKWKSFTVGKDAPVEWTATKDKAVGRLDGGKGGEIVLARNPGMSEEPVVITNLKYFGAARNDGFVLMPNEVEAYRLGPRAFEFKGTNGFMITIDMTSKDVK